MDIEEGLLRQPNTVNAAERGGDHDIPVSTGIS